MFKFKIEPRQTDSQSSGAPRSNDEPNDRLAPERLDDNFANAHQSARGPFVQFFGGILSPLVLIAGAIWFGFIQQRLTLPMDRTSTRNQLSNFRFDDTAAIWAGAALIAWALCLHWVLFHGLRGGKLFLGIVAGLAGIGLLIVAGTVN